ncbi:MAG: hypothetical protein KGH72_05610 [Candidatus Micrarchaeota archaeon]|nr:hypothetical protein [Candidatus Micrarchaeota archaeon]
MPVLIVDTSSILFAMSNHKDVFGIIKDEMPARNAVISQGIVNELTSIARKSTKNSKYARVAISLLNRHSNIKIEPDSTYVDGWIMRAAEALSCAVCTNDTKLKKALRLKNIKVYSISRNGTLV